MGGEGGSRMRAGALDGGARMQVVAVRADKITDEQIATFFATLADTCNVVRSAKAAGFSANWAYRRRKGDAAFRAGWVEAVREGYAKLELVLLERAFKGTPKLVRTARGTDRVMREYSTALGIALLRRHAEIAGSGNEEPDMVEMEEVRTRIVERLDRLRLRGTEERGAGWDGNEDPLIEYKSLARPMRVRSISRGSMSWWPAGLRLAGWGRAG